MRQLIVQTSNYKGGLKNIPTTNIIFLPRRIIWEDYAEIRFRDTHLVNQIRTLKPSKYKYLNNI